MCTNYILVICEADGTELCVRRDGKTRYQFYAKRTAVLAMEKAVECISAAQCAKLYRRRRSGGYRWVATCFRGGAHLSSWGE